MSRQSCSGAAGMNGCGVLKRRVRSGTFYGGEDARIAACYRTLREIARIARIAKMPKVKAELSGVLSPTSLQKLLAFVVYSCYKMISLPQLAD